MVKKQASRLELPAAAAPLRILMLGSVPLAQPWNGADKNLARLFVEADPHNQFIVQTDRDEPWPAPPHVTPIRAHTVESMPTSAQKLRGFGYLLRHIGDADLVHIVASLKKPSPVSATMLRSVLRLCQKPIIHTVPSAGDGDLTPLLFPGHTTVVVSEHTRRQLLERGVQNIVRIPPPLDLDHLAPRQDPHWVAHHYGLGPRAILYPAHYGPQSGIAEIIRAFAALPPELDDAVLALACRTHVGQDPQRERDGVLALAGELGVGARVRVIDRVEDMPALIQACAVTALVPARLAAKMDLPLVVLESLALGRPVVVTDRPPINEALFGGGFAVPHGDVAALTAVLRQLLESPTLRDCLARAGQAAVHETCQPARVIEQYQHLYQQAYQAQPRTRAGLGTLRLYSMCLPLGVLFDIFS